MSQAREDMNEIIRLNPFELDGELMLDIRFWKNTKAGPRPTSRGIAIKQSTIARFIWAMQKVRSQINAEEAKKEAGVL